jgi:CBS domain-containing membrane protein
MLLEIPATVAEIMTREVITVEETDTLLNLLESMRALRFRHLPVTDGERLIGLLSERDLLRVSTSNLRPPGSPPTHGFQVRDIMVRDVVSVRPEATLAAAGKLMLDKRLGCLPVVEADNTLRGILTSSDFLELVVRAGD